MAVIDPRLLRLIDTLVEVRLDWLAFELFEGIQAGRPAEEPEQALAAAREAVRSVAQPRARAEPRASHADSQQIEGDDQIEWAAAYVGERLESALAQLEASVETLGSIVAVTDPRGVGPDSATAGSVVVVVLQDEVVRETSREDVVAARAIISSLRSGLTEWSADARGQVET